MSIFSTGLSGLNAAQAALNVTSRNISNVYTPGYNRELTVLEDSVVSGGASVSAIQRQFNAFTAGQLNQATTRLEFYQVYATNTSQIDDLLADQDSGLSALMQRFFSSVSDLAAAPSDPAARQGVLGAGNSLATQFRSVSGFLEDMARGIDIQLAQEVDLVNNKADLIANLNEQITVTLARTGELPNALMNQRDQVIAELSEIVDTRVLVQGDGTYSVSIGNGQPLVSGDNAYELSIMDASDDSSRKAIGYRDSGGNILELEDDSFDGGRIGGLLAFRSEVLDSARDSIGRLAVSVASAVNEQHRAGVDLNGDPGLDFFDIGSPSAFANDRNVGTAVFSAAFGDTVDLTGTSYEIRVVDAGTGEFSITRKDDQSTTMGFLDGANQLTVDGVVLTLDDPGLLVDGDRYALQPTRFAASQFSTALVDIAQVAAGQSAATGDNLNALALQQLQSTDIVGGSASPGGGYAAILGDVGNRTNIAQINLEAQAGIRQQVRNLQQSESGVNLDEEAANLVRYQQYYQANARVIEVGTVMIDTLLGLRS